MCEIAIRCEGGDFLTITLFGRSYPGDTDHWNANWIRATVEVAAGGFHGSASGDLRAEELVEFYSQFATLQEALQGTADFATIEEWLSIHVVGNGRGHLDFRCTVRDQPGIGNTLNC